MAQNVDFRSHIRAGKFYPPQVNPALFIKRTRLVSYLLEFYDRSIPLVVVEAQAGQGKTTVIIQYLDNIDIPSAWYHIGPEDTDPAFFLHALQACLTKALPGFPLEETYKILKGADFGGFDYHQRMNLLLHDLGEACTGNMYMVFDDVHNLVSHSASLELLSYLIKMAPPCLNFILSSREELPFFEGLSWKKNRPFVKLENKDLALQEPEVFDFFQQALNLSVSVPIVRRAIQVTEGWAMGIRLYGLALGERSDPTFPELTYTAEQGMGEEVQNYFAREVLSQLEPDVHQQLLILSLLDTITVDLSEEITGNPQIGIHLATFSKRNLFLRSFGSDPSSFAFHDLIGDSLRKRALSVLGEDLIQTIYVQAGNFCCCRNQPAAALRYFIHGCDYTGVETVLQEYGMSFLASNQTITLLDILSRMPEEHRRQSGWASFYLALASMDSRPIQALPLLHQALAIFCEGGNSLGELLTLSHIISTVITTSGHYRGVEKLLTRADSLFTGLQETLPSTTIILVSRSLAMGFMIFPGNMAQATAYGNIGLQLAKANNMVNLEAALLMVMGYTYLFSGRMQQTLIALEQAARFVFLPEVGSFNVLAIRMMLFNYHFHDGDFYNYFEQKKQLFQELDNSLIGQSIAAPFSYIWEMDIAIYQGEYYTALDLAERALHESPPYGSHIISQILQQKAVVLSFLQQKGEALQLAEQSRQLREVAGGEYFIIVNTILTGFCQCLCDNHEQGLQLFSEAIDSARQMPTQYLEACGLLHRAAMYLDRGETEAAREDLLAAMPLMRKNRYRHFWAWTPHYIKSVLSLSVACGIEVEYARKLARQRLGVNLLDDGTIVPLLHFKTLGDFRIEYHADVLFQATDLTPAQRELFSLLLAAPGHSLPREILQLHFWPDAPEQSLQNKLDTLISRLRKKLAQKLPGTDPDLYLSRDRGVVRLNHIHSDCMLFLDHVRAGKNHYSVQEFWQAENEFSLANRLWHGEFMPGESGEQRIWAMRIQVDLAAEELALTWSKMMLGVNGRDQAVELVEKALQTSPLNDRLFQLLYRLEGQQSLIRAKNVALRFEQCLIKGGYTPVEVTHLLAELES